MKKHNWIYKVFLLTFLLSIIFSTITNLIAYNTNEIIIFIILIIVIIIGIIFDMIGTSSLTCNLASLHAMNAQKIRGAREAIKLVKNNAKVSNVCNDVVGDVSGIISGGLGAVLAILIANSTGLSITITSVIIAAFISALTVGGKAIFKNIAINNASFIMYNVAKIIVIFKITRKN